MLDDMLVLDASEATVEKILQKDGSSRKPDLILQDIGLPGDI